jgi:2-keto-3-deoxy-L-rhamnonate aldolase
MSSARIPPAGVFVPVPTFFKTKAASTKSRQAEVDVATQVQHSIHLATAGIKGLVLLGSTGEAIHLSSTERKSLISGVRQGLTDGGFPDYPIMAGVLTNSVDDALEQLQDAKESGAQWGLVLAPGYFGLAVTQHNIVEWYTEVADSSPIPILMYHYPGVTNNIAIDISTYVTLAAHKNIVGGKMSHGNVSHHLQVSLHPEIDHQSYALYSGFGQQLFPMVSMGGAGVIDGLAAFFPYTVVRLFNLSHSNSYSAEAMKEISELQFAVSSTEEMVGKYSIVGIKEAIYRVLGIGTMEGSRLPLKGSMGHGEWEKWSKVVDRMQVLEKTLSKKE